MQFATSSFNKTMYQRNLIRFWMIPVLYFGLMFFVGPAQFLSALGTRRYLEMPEATRLLYGQYMMGYHMRGITSPVLVMMVAICVMIAVFSYLYNTRATLTTHAFPVSRRSLYITGLASACTMMLGPQLIIAAIMTIAALAKGVFCASALGTFIFFIVCYDIIFLGIASCIIMLSGQGVTAVGFYFLANYLSLLMKFMFDVLSSALYTGLNEPSFGWGPASPAYYLGLKSGFDLKVTYAADMSGYLTAASVGMQGVGLTLIYVLVSVGLLFLGYFLYTKRPVETVNDFISFGWLKPIFVVGGSFFIGMAGAFVIDTLFSGAASVSSDANRVIVLTMMVICALVLFFVAKMIVEKSFRVFTSRNLKLCALYAVCLIFFAVFMKVDLFNVQKYTPALNKITDVKFSVGGEKYTVEDEAAINEVLGIHKDLVNILDEVEEYESEFMRNAGFVGVEKVYVDTEETYDNREYVRFFYTLDNGSYVDRSYTIAFDKKSNVSPAYKAIMQKIYEYANDYDNYNNYVYAAKLSEKTPDYLNIYRKTDGSADTQVDIADSFDNTYLQRDMENKFDFDTNVFMDEMFNAYLQDLKDGNAEVVSMQNRWSDDTVNIVMYFEIRDKQDDLYSDRYYYDYHSINVMPTLDSKNILGVYEKYGLLK